MIMILLMAPDNRDHRDHHDDRDDDYNNIIFFTK